jgi:hypothetical protein
MSRWPIFCMIAVMGLSTTSAVPIFAQPLGGIPSLNGPPPLSPWLNLNSRQGGGVDNYHNYVQPSLQLNNAMQAQQTGIQNNAAGINNMSNRDMTEWQAIHAQSNPTGMGAGFLTHRVYFMTNRQNGLGSPVATGVGMYGGRATPGVSTPPTVGGMGGMGMPSMPSMPSVSGMGRGM